jgi:membrane protein DedA with SNARE-associated domain
MINFVITLIDRYTDALELFISNQIVLAPLVLLFAEEAGVPILLPGDGVLAYVGYSVQTSQHASFWLAYVVACTAVLCGASILFFVARRFGERFIDKLGHFIFLKPSHLERAEKLFKRYGAWTIIVGRHIPGMRIPITIFAATSGVRYRTFILSTLVSTLLWIWFYLSVGKRYGSSFRHLISQSVTVTIGVVIAGALLVVGLHLYGRHSRRTDKLSR